MTAVPTVVVVDDADDVRELVKTYLRLSQRLDVVGEGANGLEAIELVAAHQPDLLLLDVSMPQMDGLEALPRIRDVSPRTRVVMFTGFDQRGLADRALELGAAALLEKSISIRTLADELIRILDAGPYHPPPAVQTPEPSDETTPRADHDILGEHLERFREVFEEAAIGLGTMTLSGRLVRSNKALCELVERREDELVGYAYSELIADGESARFRAVIDDVTVGGRDTARLEHEVDVGGVGRLVLATLAPVRDANRQPLYLFIQVQDITVQRVAEEALRQSEERFRLLVETVRDYAIFMLSPDGHIESWNVGAQRLKGYTADEIIGQHFRVFYPADKQAVRHPEHELEIAVRDGRYEEEGWRIRKDGTQFWANVVITALFDSSGAHVGFAKVTRDVTERRQLLDEQVAAGEALAAANRDLAVANQRLAKAADERTQFLAVTAHELRTPVGIIGGFAELLRQHWRELEEGERAEMLDSMTTNATRLRRLLDDLLMAARLEANAIELTYEDVSITALLTTTVGTARTQHEDQELRLEVEEGLTVRGDSVRIAQAVDNLITNALRHGKAPVEVSGRRNGTRVEIRVSDHGAGVPPEMVSRLFDRFATGARHGGTGLGLFIVRQLARAHQGDTWYEPGGGGSLPTFVFAVPIDAVP